MPKSDVDFSTSWIHDPSFKVVGLLAQSQLLSMVHKFTRVLWLGLWGVNSSSLMLASFIHF